MPPVHFVGVDVQATRGCCFAVLDAAGGPVESGWLAPAGPRPTARAARDLAERLSRGDPASIALGVDAPRRPLPRARRAYWEGRTGAWRPARRGDRGVGRHAEAVIAAYGLARPQWTPLARSAPPWMRYGFALFRILDRFPHLYEVFPSAAYSQLSGYTDVTLTIALRHFSRGPKDMLDAHVAALTAREVVMGRGAEVGGGDGLGTIALPRPLAAGPLDVLTWPVPTRRSRA